MRQGKVESSPLVHSRRGRAEKTVKSLSAPDNQQEALNLMIERARFMTSQPGSGAPGLGGHHPDGPSSFWRLGGDNIVRRQRPPDALEYELTG